MKNDFEFRFFGTHLLANSVVGIIAATIIALATIVIAGAIIYKLGPRDLAVLGRAALLKYAKAAPSPTLSSPAEQAERSEGKGTHRR